MFTLDKDFVVEDFHGVIRCRAKTPMAASAFKVVQIQAQRLAEQLPDGPRVAITVDGVLGPSTALAVQMIALRLAESGHSELADLGMAQPEEAIPAIAASAMEIAGYFERVTQQAPTALIAPEPPKDNSIDPVEFLKSIFTGKRIAAIGGVLLGIGGLAAIAGVSDRRSLGRVDRSHMLPDSDGSDEFEEEDDTVDEYEEEDTYPHQESYREPELPRAPMVEPAAHEDDRLNSP